MKIQGRKILITGGSSGIGKALAMLCAQSGAQVAILGHTQEHIDQTLAQIKSMGFTCYGMCVDLADVTATKTAVETMFREFGDVDILVNNAGYAIYETFYESSLDEILNIIRVNLLGAVTVSKLILDRMVLKKNLGFVVNVASVAASLPITPCAAYSISKQGQRSMADLLAHEYSPFGIKFSLVLPGRVDTPFFDHPSFASQHQRPENKGMLTATTVAHDIFYAIENEKAYVVTPVKFHFAIWLYNALPWFLEPVLRYILRKRIRDHYDRVGWPEGQQAKRH